MIYLDNSATTELSENVKAAMTAAMESFGNPSSLHSLGLEAEKRLKANRSAVLSALSATDGKLIFTSCGSEASNLAIFGTVNAKTRRISNRILTTDSEHPSVENSLSALEKQGYEVIRIPTHGGEPDKSAVEAAMQQPIFLVSMMLVNNETGALYDVGSVFSAVKRKYPDAVCHCDAVQGFLRVPFSPKSLDADLITVSGHKIHAPKGVGALWVSSRIIKEKKLTPTLLGGGQEEGFRSGTENTVGIAGFATAAEEGKRLFSSNYTALSELHAYAVKRLGSLDGARLNLPKNAAPHILSLTLPDIKSETMLHFLSSHGICVSSGSACSSHSGKQSRTLLAFGLTPRAADCTIRISFSEYNKKSDIDALASALAEGITGLVRIK